MELRKKKKIQATPTTTTKPKVTIVSIQFCRQAFQMYRENTLSRSQHSGSIHYSIMDVERIHFSQNKKPSI